MSWVLSVNVNIGDGRNSHYINDDGDNNDHNNDNNKYNVDRQRKIVEATKGGREGATS